MKKLLSLILAFAMCLSMVACGDSAGPAQQEGTTKAEASTVVSKTESEKSSDEASAKEPKKDDTGISESYLTIDNGETLIGRFKNELDHDVHLTVEFTLTDTDGYEFFYGYVEQPCLRAGEEYIAVLCEEEPFVDYFTDITIESVNAQDAALYAGVDIQSQVNEYRNVDAQIYSDSEYNATVTAFFFDETGEIVGYDEYGISGGADEEPFDLTFDYPADHEDYDSYKIIFSSFD